MTNRANSSLNLLHLILTLAITLSMYPPRLPISSSTQQKLPIISKEPPGHLKESISRVSKAFMDPLHLPQTFLSLIICQLTHCTSCVHTAYTGYTVYRSCFTPFLQTEQGLTLTLPEQSRALSVFLLTRTLVLAKLNLRPQDSRLCFSSQNFAFSCDLESDMRVRLAVYSRQFPGWRTLMRKKRLRAEP